MFTREDLGVFIGVLILALLAVGGYNFFHWLFFRPKLSLSPYSRTPLIKASDMPYQTKIAVLRYLFRLHEYDNRIFKLSQAAVCRVTGRIFPHCVDWLNRIHVDWTFLAKKYSGDWVSWGSLTNLQRDAILSVHKTLDGFQTDFSCPHPAPNKIEAKYAFTKPGPLYVDLKTQNLLGWKCVPDTEVEVLIVQHPKDYEPKMRE